MSNKIIGTVILVAAVLVAGFMILARKSPNQTGSTTQQVTQTSAGPCDASHTKQVVMVGKSDLGNYLADSKCMTLYVSSQDKAGVSNCNDTCAQTWLPFAYDNADLSKLTNPIYKFLNIIKRTDGTYQYAYGNTPLYYYKGDVKAGDMKGNGMNNGTWSVILLDKQGTK